MPKELYEAQLKMKKSMVQCNWVSNLKNDEL